MIRILAGTALTLLALGLLMAMTIATLAPGLGLAFACYATLLAGMLLAAHGATTLPRRRPVADRSSRD